MNDLILKNKKKDQAESLAKNGILKGKKGPGNSARQRRNEEEDGYDPEVFDLLKAEEETGSLSEARRYFENDRVKVKESRFTEENTLLEEGFDDW
ncbi:hypothetical protein TH53_18015 [Pedobacter lusitanus]|uniref:Uncharacterized protein n=1 Tax=Pedobacter lusitanus TaxID=1503925 RepID=A0A0D0F321_9SPHI|nr:hypothetical protein [Pedobacter lusitanus]KIO75958.1 hypothetical protein TH53_18015 [Pedobacter lusitanus]